MIYFVVAQQEVDGVWKLFGPWENIEKADVELSRLDALPQYSQVEIARVLTEEDNPDMEEWSDSDKHEKPQKAHILYHPFIMCPDHWPKRYNAYNEPCDMLEGLCVCGAWHNQNEDWAKIMIELHGLEK